MFETTFGIALVDVLAYVNLPSFKRCFKMKIVENGDLILEKRFPISIPLLECKVEKNKKGNKRGWKS